ncbi:cytochrome P450 4C1-like [Pieris rapae]|uniref:cytochrome P450 4C1-like n=1 Tax=Pieris rapae TaxID=64459 RepID=UPI001E27CEAA|nr:cytochrome P450 4C1-like [Pieris rapae]
MWWILLVILTILVCVEWLVKCKEFQIIPGPKGIYILHNALDVIIEPAKLFSYLRTWASTYKSLFRLQLGPVKVILIHNPEDIEKVINGTKYTTKGFLYYFIQPWLKEGILTSKGKKWHARRKMITPTFHFNILNNFKRIMEHNVEKLTDHFKSEVNKPYTEVSEFLHDFTLHTICETAMSIKLDEKSGDYNEFKENIRKLMHYAVYRAQRLWMYPDFIFNLTNLGRKQRKSLDILESFRAQVVKKRRECKTEDEWINDEEESSKRRLGLLDILLQAEKDGLIDYNGICEEVDTFLFGGYDTTAIALKFIILLLANHNDVQEKIIEELDTILGSSKDEITIADLAEMKYLDACIKETMRLYPPIPAITRNIDEPLQLRGYEIPTGTEAVILIYDLHRRADQFVEPLAFKPERFLAEPTWHTYSYIPFSAGARNCIGRKFAMIEMKLVVLSLLRRFRLLPVTKTDDLVFATDYVLQTTQPIYVKFQERNKEAE